MPKPSVLSSNKKGWKATLTCSLIHPFNVQISEHKTQMICWNNVINNFGTENGNPEILTNKPFSLHRSLLACWYTVNKNYNSNLVCILLRKWLREGSSNIFLGQPGNKVSHLDYCLRCASCFFNLQLYWKAWDVFILNLDTFHVSQHNCKLKISTYNVASDLAEGGLYSLKCSKICS